MEELRRIQRVICKDSYYSSILSAVSLSSFSTCLFTPSTNPPTKSPPFVLTSTTTTGISTPTASHTLLKPPPSLSAPVRLAKLWANWGDLSTFSRALLGSVRFSLGWRIDEGSKESRTEIWDWESCESRGIVFVGVSKRESVRGGWRDWGCCVRLGGTEIEEMRFWRKEVAPEEDETAWGLLVFVVAAVVLVLAVGKESELRVMLVNFTQYKRFGTMLWGKE